MKYIKVVIEGTGGGNCSLYVEGLKKAGIYSTGKSIPDGLRNLAEAWELYQEKVDKPHPAIKKGKKK